jgi:5'-methylthioadenosine phosphorylase
MRPAAQRLAAQAEKGEVAMSLPKAELGVFGGSGFYSFLDGVTEHAVETPYGDPSDKLAIGEVEGHKVAFLPRHGRRHQYPPHRINYRANLWAMKQLGVTRVIGPCAAGSLQPEAEPGHFVVCDQIVDRTSGRPDTFYDGPETTHISFADPYCPELRSLAVEKAKQLGITVHDGGTMVVIQGPRFSTRAESKWFQQAGWEVINMTGHPEALLARELELCYVNVSLITDYDVGLEGMPGISPVSHAEVVRVFEENNAKLKDLLMALLPAIPGERSCPCATALTGARFEA